MTFRKAITEDYKYFKINCDCGCDSSNIELYVEKDEHGFWSLNLDIRDARYYVHDVYHDWRIIEFAQTFWKRLKAAAKIMYNGNVKYTSGSMIGNANIDDLYAAVVEARKDIKKNKSL